jgi:hypothetical protein
MKRQILVVSVLLVFFFLSSSSLATNWWWPPTGGAQVVPSNPSTSDIVAITLSGDWPDSCVPIGSSVSVIGSNIYFNVFSNPSGICLDIVMGWHQSQSVGPLAAGTYHIYASLDGFGYTYMTAFTVTNQQFIISTGTLTVPEGQNNTFTASLLTDPCGTVQATVARESGDTDITVQSGASLTFNSSTYSIPQTVTLAAAEDDDLLDGTAVITISAAGYMTSEVVATEADNDMPPVLYVDTDAVGGNNGRNWTNAFTNLQDALSIAAAYPQVEEIRVAQGTYKPAGGRNDKFQLVYGLVVKGSYAGFGSIEPDTRNSEIYKTILSGDINGDDGPNFTNRADNCYTVVNGNYMAVLDGFVITGGEGGAHAGGVYVGSSNTIISNCTIINNRAGYGGGLYSYKGSPTLINCMFIGNEAKPNSIGDGGGIYSASDGSSCNPTLINCSFINNSANDTGGGVCGLSSCEMTVTNCIFWGNSDAGGTDESAQIHAGNLLINYSCIQGWTGSFGGTGNTGSDPLFVTGSFGNYYLSQVAAGQASDSPCVNTGSDTAVNLGMNELTTRTDNIADEGIVDMGYHYPLPNPADINADGKVNFADFAILASQWLQLPGVPSADIAPDIHDNFVDEKDLAVLAENWLMGT